MIFPWHTDLSQPGRRVCVVFRASPLIWPTPYLARTTRPGPSLRCTPGGFPRGAMGVRGATTKGCHPRRREPIGDLVPQSPWGSQLCALLRRGLSVCDV